jgi:hypothetical protein
MAFFGVSISNTAMNTANDLLTLISAASRRNRLCMADVNGMGNTSAQGEIGVFRSTAGTTGSGAKTPTKYMSDAPTQAFTNFTGWAAQPTLSGDGIWRLGVNQNGAINRLRAPVNKDEQIEFRNAEQLSIRPVVGSHNITMSTEVEEI